MKLKYRKAKDQFLCHVQAWSIPEKQKFWLKQKYSQITHAAFLANQSIGKSSNFTVSFLDQNEPAWHCPLLTLRTADTVVNCHLNHTYIIISPSANTNKVLALLKISWVFICNRDFYWELRRKSQHLYSFDLSTLPVQLRSLEHTSSIALWSQLAWDLACILADLCWVVVDIVTLPSPTLYSILVQLSTC